MSGFAKVSLLGVCLSVALATSAGAECYDVFGCTNRDYFRVPDLLSGPNCEFLYTMRNEIYYEHHYCFHTPRAIAAFGNAGCVSGNPNVLGLNRAELSNAATILQGEHMKGCPE